MPPPLSFPPVDGQLVHFIEAIRAAEARNIVLPDIYYGQLQGVARQLAFTIASVASHDQLKAVMDSLSTWQANGKTFAQWQREIAVKDLELPKYRLENIFRTNLQSNYQAGHWEQILRNQQHRPYLMYDAINDSRTRPAHRAMDGIIRPADDPFWETHSPPNGYRCRCGLISLTGAQAKARSNTGNNKKPAAGLEKAIDETTMQPDKGWDYSPRDRLKGIRLAADKRMDNNDMLSSALEIKLTKASMDLNVIYSQAEKIKPAFDNKIRLIAEAVKGDAVMPPLKSKGRAEAKINIDHNGDASKIRDIVRASIIVDSPEQVNLGFEKVLNDFKVDASRNGYLSQVHSSDGYFDAKLDVEFLGFFAEIQLHTKAMWNAKGLAHSLYEQRQAILRAAKDSVLLPEQKKRIAEINKQMREIYRKAATDD